MGIILKVPSSVKILKKENLKRAALPQRQPGNGGGWSKYCFIGFSTLCLINLGQKWMPCNVIAIKCYTPVTL